jgi:2-isopropylmalate synthase
MHPKEGIYLLDDQVQIYDTTLRDGAQTEGISFSNEDKVEILAQLDSFGIDFVEGGYPASNPKDKSFFREAQKVRLHGAKLVAFGSTRKKGRRAEEDHSIRSLLESGTEWVCLFGKSWDLHVNKVLRMSLMDNLKAIEDSVSHLASKERRLIFDAEHFFDGWKENPSYAIEVVETAEKAGAEWVVLCDTNGGSLPNEIANAVGEVRKSTRARLGVHMHNDSDLAVANSLAAVEVGATMVQGTINGLGERCGNANLCSVIPALVLKMGRKTSVSDLKDLTSVSAFVGEVANVLPYPRLPYVGMSAFAHKGGIHVSAVMKDPRTYEHIEPEIVGNKRRVIVSELTGISGVLAKAKELGIDEDGEEGRAVLERLKAMESEGFQFEGAEASFELLVRRLREKVRIPFKLEGFRVLVDVSEDAMRSEAIVKVMDPRGEVEHTASDGNGPVNALDRALRKALIRFFPQIREIRLVDYKVRVIDTKSATAARVRVLIKSTDGVRTWTTVGASANIIEASLMALLDSIEYKLLHAEI